VKISVTADNISASEPGNACACPLALAFRAAGFDVAIGLASIDFYNHLKEWVAELPLPPAALYFRYQFDNGDPVAPFEFDMPELTAGVLPVSHFQSVPVV
jgi:hypothetical protein